MPKHLSANETGAFTRTRPDTVRAAILAGALPAIDRGPGRVGRRPRFLINEADALDWLRAGCPVTKPVVAP